MAKKEPRRKRREAFRRLLVESLEHRFLLVSWPVITEFMARNDGVLNDGDGNSSDWIEVYNPGNESVNLSGFRLTDKHDDPFR
jgi:hypothetical protein